MIDFLKESTFAVNEVIAAAWQDLKKYYFSIAGLCVLVFVISAASSVSGYYLNHVGKSFSLLMIVFFSLSYFVTQLTLLKYIFLTLDAGAGSASLKEALPTVKEMVNTLTAGFYFLLCIALVFALVSLAALPLAYLGLGPGMAAQLAIFVAAIMILITWLRISFFPFFIIDKQAPPFRSIRLSLAITRGNFTRILILLGFFAFFHALYLYLNYRGYYIMAGMVTAINSFLIVPLSSVALAVAYRKMMSDYHGDADPDILHHLL